MNPNKEPYDPFAWSSRPYGRVFNNLTISDTPEGYLEIAEITGAALMDTAAKSGALTAIFDSRNQWYALHDTPFCWKHPGLGSRDIVAELIEAGKERGVQYVPYIPVDCDMRAFQEHPEWRNVAADGTVTDSVFPRMCENSPFRDFMAGYIIDLLSRYDINGLWFDGLGVHKSCYCKYCREGFAGHAGMDAPTSEISDPESWKVWVQYKHNATEMAFKTFFDAANSIRPGIPIHTAWESGIRTSAQSWVEAYWKWPTPYLQMIRNDSGKVGEFYVLTVQYAPSFPITLSTAEIRDRAMCSFANGTIPNFTLTTIPERIAQINDELAQRAPWFVNAEPVPYVAVAQSERSRQLCEKDPYKDGPDFTLYGTVMALLEEKIPQSCLSEYNLLHNDLSEYAAIVLPDVGIITDEVCVRLRSYVQQGGGLVASGRTSLYADDGTQLPDFRLADLFGVHFQGELPSKLALPDWLSGHDGSGAPNSIGCNFMKLEDHPITNDPLIRESYSHEVIPAFRRGKPRQAQLAFPGPMFCVRPDSGVSSVLSEEFQNPGQSWPLISTREYGKGRVVYMASDLGFQYASHWTYPFVRRLQTNAVRWATGDSVPPVVIESLLQVHATLYRQKSPERLVVHLLNSPSPQGYPPMTRQSWGQHSQRHGPIDAPERDIYFTPFGRMREDLAPVHDIKVCLRGTFKRVYSAPQNIDLPTEVVNGYTQVTVPQLDVHLMVVAEP